MGRPKARVDAMTTVRITETAYERARLVAKETGESIVSYVSRVVADQALRDLEVVARDVEASATTRAAELKRRIEEEKKKSEPPPGPAPRKAGKGKEKGGQS